MFESSSLVPEYPVNAFPKVMRNAILEMQYNFKAPLAMIGTAFLTAISLAMQNAINVCRMDGLSGPVSLSFLIVAGSGERKSAIMNAVLKPIFQLEDELYSRFQKEHMAYKSELLIHRSKEKRILALVQKGDDTEEVQNEWEELIYNKPNEPTLKRFIFIDATPAALKGYLCGDWRAIGLISDEAAMILDGHAFKELSFINKLWDGATLPIDRKGSPSAIIKDARLTVSLMVQPEALNEFLSRKGDIAKGIGFFARFFVCQPTSTQGTRIIDSPVIYTEHLQKFHKRLMELALESLAVHGEENRICLKFTPEAQSHWIKFFNDIEKRIGLFGDLAEFKDLISKLSDNVARVAGLFHYYSGDEGDIPLSTVKNAISITAWYADEYKRMFKKINPMNALLIDAQELHKWMLEFCRSHNITYIYQTVILNYGPNRLRTGAKIGELLEYLEAKGAVKLGKEGKKVCVLPIDVFWY